MPTLTTQTLILTLLILLSWRFTMSHRHPVIMPASVTAPTATLNGLVHAGLAFPPTRVRVALQTATTGQAAACAAITAVVLPADLVSELEVSIKTIPSVGQVVKVSVRIEGSRKSHEFIPVGLTTQAGTIITQLLIGSARVTQYEGQLDKLAERIVKIGKGEAKGDVQPLQDKRAALVELLKAKRAECASFREGMGLSSAAYREALKA